MRTTLRPAVRSLLIASTEFVLGPGKDCQIDMLLIDLIDLPIVQMIEVLRKFLVGLYSVSSCESLQDVDCQHSSVQMLNLGKL